MSGYKIALGFASALLLLGSVAAQQSAPCQPQRPTATTPFDACKYWPLALGPGVHAPRPLSAPDPEYSEAARKAKLNGSVVLAVAVSEKGHVDDVKVVRSSNQVFEPNAIDAAKQWVFSPATKDGKPIAAQENIEMNFRLY